MCFRNHKLLHLIIPGCLVLVFDLKIREPRPLVIFDSMSSCVNPRYLWIQTWSADMSVPVATGKITLVLEGIYFLSIGDRSSQVLWPGVPGLRHWHE